MRPHHTHRDQIILKWIFKVNSVKVWTGLNCLQSDGEFCEYDDELLVCIQAENLFTSLSHLLEGFVICEQRHFGKVLYLHTKSLILAQDFKVLVSY